MGIREILENRWYVVFIRTGKKNVVDIISGPYVRQVEAERVPRGVLDVVRRGSIVRFLVNRYGYKLTWRC